jgi:hypothetical protein
MLRYQTRAMLLAVTLLMLMARGSAPAPVLAAPPNDDIADVAIGTPRGFTTDLCNGGLASPTRSTLCNPNGVAWDGSGNLWIADTNNGRVLEYDAPCRRTRCPTACSGSRTSRPVTRPVQTSARRP